MNFIQLDDPRFVCVLVAREMAATGPFTSRISLDLGRDRHVQSDESFRVSDPRRWDFTIIGYMVLYREYITNSDIKVAR